MDSAIDSVSYLDRRVDMTTPGVTVIYSGGVTTWTFPYSVALDGTEGTLIVVVLDTPAIVSTSARTIPNQISAAGNYTGRPFYIGVIYPAHFIPSQVFVRDRNGRPDESSKLTLRRLKVIFEQVTDLTVVVARFGGKRTEASKEFTRATDGEWSVGIHGVNDLVQVGITSAGPGGFSLKGLVWEGDVHPRAQKV